MIYNSIELILTPSGNVYPWTRRYTKINLHYRENIQGQYFRRNNFLEIFSLISYF